MISRRLNILLGLMIFSLSLVAQQYRVELVGGEVKKVSSLNVVREKYELPYLRVSDSEMYRMEQVQSFRNQDGYFIKNDLTVSKLDFARRVVEGKVEVFRYDLSSNYIQTGQSNTRDYYAYKKDGGVLKQMIYDNLSKDLEDNAESMAKLDKIQKAKKIAPLYYGLGVASVLTGAVLFNTDQSDYTFPLFISGGVFFAIPWVLNSKRQQRMNQAVKIYNGK